MITDDKKCKIYKRKGKNKPGVGCGPLAIFTSLEEAIKWSNEHNHIIFECNYKQSKDKKLWVKGDKKNYRTFIHYRDILCHWLCDYADEVTLLKEVPRS